MAGIPIVRLLGLVCMLVMSGFTAAQVTAAQEGRPAAMQRTGLDVLKGTWVRPDGGYMIVVSSVGTNGQLEATYFNPRQLPFAKAAAVQDSGAIRVFLELQAGGYNGSTYALSYDPATDHLKGKYHQAVAKQTFDVYFVRK